jgi:hypothetical protein
MYGKFFKSTFTGSMCGAGADVFAVWGYVIANKVKSAVELNPVVLSGLIGMTPDRVSAAIDHLCKPDPNSRNPAHEGKRLVREGVFQYFVVSDDIYAAIRDEDSRREYNRRKKQEERGRKKASNEMSMTVSDCQEMSTAVSYGQPQSAHKDKDKDKTPGKAQPVIPIGKEKNRNEGFSPIEVAQAVIQEAQAGGRYALASLTDIAKGLMSAGIDADTARDKMLSRWNEYKQAAGKLKYTMGSIEKFFTGGLWDNPDAWPWQDNMRPAPKSKARLLA